MTLQLVICIDAVDTARVSLSGQLDMVNSNSFFHQILALINGGHVDLELDLSGVEAADPAGLGSVLAAGERAGIVGGSLHLTGVRTPVREVMVKIGWGRFSALCDDSSFPPGDAAAHGGAPELAQRVNASASAPAARLRGRRLVDTPAA